MSKDEPQKAVVRLVLIGPQVEAADQLCEHFAQGNYQDLFKFLLSAEIKKLKESKIRYGSKRVARETAAPGPVGPSVSEIVEEAFTNPDPRMLVGFLGEIGYFPAGAVVNVIPGHQYAATFNDVDRVQMPAGFDQKNYVRVDIQGDVSHFPVDDEEEIAQVKKFLKQQRGEK